MGNLSEAKAIIWASLISGSFGIAATVIATSDRSLSLLSGELPQSICTTVDGKIGRVLLTTAIFNDAIDSFHGFSQEHSVAPNRWGISNDDVEDLTKVPGSHLARHWGAKWECI